MATSLLRLGRLGALKCLQQDGWGSLRTPLTAAFCTKAEAPKKPAKKASTLEASDERAALLAYKTTVAFPTRLSAPGFLSQGVSLGEYEQSRDPVTDASAESVTTAHAKQAESVADDSAKVQTESCDVGAAAEAPPKTETATEKDATSTTGADVKAPKSEVASKDDDATSSSSSSSSSDSDSDSDSDDEKPDKNEIIEPVVQTEDKRQEEMPSAVSEKPASDVKTAAVPERVQPFVPEGAIKRAPKGAPKGAPDVAEAVSESTSEQVPSSSTAAASSEEIVDPAPVLCRAESVKAQAEVIPEKNAGVAVKSLEDSGAIPEPVTEGASDVAAEPTPKVVLDSTTEVAPEPEVEIKAAPETMEAVPERVQPFVPERAPEGAIKRAPEGAPDVAEAVSESTSEQVPSSSTAAASSEEIVDPAPVITVAEEVQAEPEVAAAPEEAAAAPAPEPEPEPFDNTTYKNLQHHSYHTYTFVDMDVEMAKHRLPQPSTGRPSPRH
ncbi:myristoylated alanine-rich C-kinase substrate isoform X2 [Ictalurus furcatus]|uniref:myristoylated alanine-rich C-kinase substrate isoform X2 n=1 Tax=Ictalurus furcatus TaxID=66913 RepID=UPI00235073F7|nr:myristoylated alanine-rich C-kinase substrate isoform X2 [Ictalurus furcatus]